jgi:hypothetical protein
MIAPSLVVAAPASLQLYLPLAPLAAKPAPATALRPRRLSRPQAYAERAIDARRSWHAIITSWSAGARRLSPTPLVWIPKET